LHLNLKVVATKTRIRSVLARKEKKYRVMVRGASQKEIKKEKKGEGMKCQALGAKAQTTAGKGKRKAGLEDQTGSVLPQLGEAPILERLAQRTVEKLSDAIASPRRALGISCADPSCHFHAFL
jgi:hypothetical protein